jgi:acetyltransferase-like isoleucine patch superfamily enzyme
MTSSITRWVSNQINWHLKPKLHRAHVFLKSKKVKKRICGTGNIINGFRTSGKSSIKVQGNNNEVIAAKSLISNSITINITGSDNIVEFGENVIIEKLNIHISGQNCKFYIGEDSYVAYSEIIIGESGTRVVIGNQCMIASGVEIRTTDSHGIFDLKSGDCINRGNDVVVESHVWLANGVLLLKGAIIPTGSIIGARSIVTKKLDHENAIYAGCPAKMIRSSVVWGWQTGQTPSLIDV